MLRSGMPSLLLPVCRPPGPRPTLPFRVAESKQTAEAESTDATPLGQAVSGDCPELTTDTYAGGTPSVTPFRVDTYAGRPPMDSLNDVDIGAIDTTVVHGLVVLVSGCVQPLISAPTRSGSHRIVPPWTVALPGRGGIFTVPAWVHMMVAFVVTTEPGTAPAYAVEAWAFRTRRGPSRPEQS
jgi:hypothetical protein